MRYLPALIVSLISLLSLPAFGQRNIIIEADKPIAQMMARYAEINKSKKLVEGWRVQILATPDRQRLETVKQSFQYRYPNVPVDWEHAKPYYKLRAGAFSSKVEAMRLKYILEKDYPGIYLVKDDQITPRELISTGGY
ncbi:SPOR domain-containing protein [Phaeodactylibacter luteus]|uniref:SPOR domain-containing protein n=1 Tax=Phaeodactylibacter luteus TaxID=1564516 RepID=A0A5C6RJ61_9BACT|nr:SPOR domain-containing protein [Phaeodactylibacter luteus]TXB62009.1 SPOR domain-containing protein [Phaeodactylibacter luteus]